MHTYNPRTWEAETRESDVKATVSPLHSKFKANLGYMKLSKKKKKKTEDPTAVIEVIWVKKSHTS